MTRIGVTGHRRLMATNALQQAIDGALERITAVFTDPQTMISPLAEGADQYVVQRAFAVGHPRLIVPLPLAKEAYLRGFASPEGRAEFERLVGLADEVVVMSPRATEVEAYHAVGHWVLDHSDVLVAVWDGRPPRSIAGTGAIVETARVRHLPIAWVEAEQTRDRDRAIAVHYERF